MNLVKFSQAIYKISSSQTSETHGQSTDVQPENMIPAAPSDGEGVKTINDASREFTML